MLIALCEQGPVRPSALAEHFDLDLSTVSRQIGALEAAGWVSREKDPADKRAQLARLSPEGNEVLQANLAARRALLAGLLTDWTDDERLEFARLLGRLNQSFTTHPATTPHGTC
jgi:DNA-binding MarR family transcriptional regulator